MDSRRRLRLRAAELLWSGAWLLCWFGVGSFASCTPTIEITTLPEYGSFDNLAGRVSGVEPSTCRVAAYIFVPPYGWYAKPTCAQPLTVIQPDGSWAADITTGGIDQLATRVAALLVPTNFEADCVLGLPFLPTDVFAQALASAVVTRRHPGVRWLSFSGHDWWVKSSTEPVGPGPNYFSDSTDNVWVDGVGRLHLRITNRSGRWECAEIVSGRTFGFGWYRFLIESPMYSFDTNVVLGLFTWSDDPAWANREIDFERLCVDTSGRIDANNFQFVVQPWYLPGHVVRFKLLAEASSSVHVFCWEPNRVRFRSRAGGLAPGTASTNVLKTWVYSLATPQSGDENVRLNLWLYNGNPPVDGQEVEVIIGRFEFSPLHKPFGPIVTRAALEQTNVVLVGTDGMPDTPYRVLTSTDLALPLKDWTALKTNRFDALGNFVCRVGVDSAPGLRFFVLELE